jgi:hypothetical protein
MTTCCMSISILCIFLFYYLILSLLFSSLFNFCKHISSLNNEERINTYPTEPVNGVNKKIHIIPRLVEQVCNKC